MGNETSVHRKELLRYLTKVDHELYKKEVENMHTRVGKRVDEVEEQGDGDHDRITAFMGIGAAPVTVDALQQKDTAQDARLGKVEKKVDHLSRKLVAAGLGGSVGGGGIVALLIKLLSS